MDGYQKRFFDAGRFAPGKLKDGETFSVDSGMGGSFTVECKGHDERGWPMFRSCDPGWEGKIIYNLSPELMAERLFVWVRAE